MKHKGGETFALWAILSDVVGALSVALRGSSVGADDPFLCSFGTASRSLLPFRRKARVAEREANGINPRFFPISPFQKGIDGE